MNLFQKNQSDKILNCYFQKSNQGKALIGETRRWTDGEDYTKTKDGWVKKEVGEKKREENLKIVHSTLNELASKYYLDLNRVKIIFGNGKDKASVSKDFQEDPEGKFFIDGKKQSKTSETLRLYLSDHLLISPPDVIKRTTTHEFAHLLQHLWMVPKDLDELRKTPGDKFKFTSYTTNMLEVQAEAFTVMECGESNFSRQKAIQTADYQEALAHFWSYSPF